jgi:hypothetical protein
MASYLHPEMSRLTRPRVNVSDQTVDLGSNFFTGSVLLTCKAEMNASGGADELECNEKLAPEGTEFNIPRG